METEPTRRAPALRIFVVENHKDTLLWLTRYLEEMGHSVASATTMKEALEVLPGADYDVLLSDIGLPDGDGWELLGRLPGRRPEFAIAMSGYGTNGDRARSKAAGYRHHILKPFDPELLDSLLLEAAGQGKN
jgi:CheY-like chemotaxis protein